MRPNQSAFMSNHTPLLTSHRRQSERTVRKIVTNLKALIWRQFFSFHFLLVLGPGRDLLPVDIPICQQNKHGHKNSSLNTPHFIFLSHNTMQWPHFMYFFKVSKGHNYRHRPNISILWHLTQPSTEMFEISILKSLQKYFKSLCWKWTGIQLLSPSNQYHNKPRLWCRHSAWQFYHPNWIHPCSQLSYQHPLDEHQELSRNEELLIMIICKLWFRMACCLEKRKIVF